MKKYTKKEIINKICESAKLYEKNLLNKNIMFIFENNKESLFIETLFTESNFKHLTGVEYNKNASQFLYNSLNKRLSENDISIPKNKMAFTFLKLDVLESAMSIDKTAKMIGNFNYGMENLKIEKVVGNVRLCIGFSKLTSHGKELKYYYPKTLLKGRIDYNSSINEIYKINCILSKNRKENLYNEITYLKNNINFEKIFSDKSIKLKIDDKKIHSENSVYQSKINEYFNKFIDF